MFGFFVDDDDDDDDDDDEDEDDDEHDDCGDLRFLGAGGSEIQAGLEDHPEVQQAIAEAIFWPLQPSSSNHGSLGYICGCLP